MEPVEHLIGGHERFGPLWRRMGASDDGSSTLGALLQAYDEPHRHYHGIDHLRDCLAQLDASPAVGPDRDLAETALWFHDAVHLPGADDNETRSAAWAASAMMAAGIAEAPAHEVARLVRLTDHTRPSDDPVGDLVCDVDLSILGREWGEFAEYERRIRSEYHRVADPLYRIGRAAVLTRFLAREPLYRTEHFRARYETRARENLKRSLASLGTSSASQ